MKMKSETIKGSNTKKIREFIVYFVESDKLFGKSFPFFSIILADKNKRFSFPSIRIELGGKGKKGFENLKPLEPIKVTFERVSKEGEENEK